ncbi:unnamed protein product [Microthlaspi erraticum]|uniref:Uncharacterized protein n=1 Tax=Microthlaspi erraticum TaxID=1685480 RepID=A0A6D2KMS8_9BRAS|nr:unnamed protein product [Microthlaspi erraticum]
MADEVVPVPLRRLVAWHAKNLASAALVSVFTGFYLVPIFLFYSGEILHAVFVEKNIGVILYLLCLGAAGWFIFPSEDSLESLERERAELQRFGHVAPMTPADFDQHLHFSSVLPPWSSAPPPWSFAPPHFSSVPPPWTSAPLCPPWSPASSVPPSWTGSSPPWSFADSPASSRSSSFPNFPSSPVDTAYPPSTDTSSRMAATDISFSNDDSNIDTKATRFIENFKSQLNREL